MRERERGRERERERDRQTDRDLEREVGQDLVACLRNSKMHTLILLFRLSSSGYPR